MAKITFKGDSIHTSGNLPSVGSDAPGFKLVANDLSEVELAGFAGKSVVLNIFPSLDTPVCATTVRRFNELAAGREGTVVLCISADLPFAHSRFCGAEGIEGVESLSTFRNADFADAYGMRIVDGALAGVMGRAVVIVDSEGKVTYTELVPEIAQEPDYDAALAAL